MKLIEILDRPIAYHRSFVPFAGVTGAILLSQALYWNNRTRDADGWFYKTREEWESETGLTRREQEEARKTLCAKGVLEEVRKGLPAKLYFKVNVPALREILQSVPSSLLETDQLVGTEDLASNQPQNARTNLSVHENQPQNEPKKPVPTIYTETTTETTTKNKDKHDGTLKQYAININNTFNQVYGKRYKAIDPLLSGLGHWLTVYSIEDILEAIRNSKQDEYWSDKMEPTLLLRRRNPKGEQVDYIGKFINMKVNHFDSTPATLLQQWEIAKELDVHPLHVAEKHGAILAEAQAEGNVTKRYPNVIEALRGWISYGISKGELDKLGEFGETILREWHPEQRKKLEEAKAILREQGKL